MFSKTKTNSSIENYSDKIQQIRQKLEEADAVVIGAGSGLSTSAGFTYDGERFEKYFYDFAEKYPIRDMYSGGFYPFASLEEYWAWWSRHIWFNRYVKAPKPVYEDLLDLVRDKDYFVLTTNVDHRFQQAGFDKKRLYYMQGDYGLLQCSGPCHKETYDNRDLTERMVLAQGFIKSEDGELLLPEKGTLKMEVPSELVPKCPRCGRPMIVNLRCDDTFVEDEGWHQAAERYSMFRRRHENLNVVYLELGVGMNTPVWIKYPFWKYTELNGNATYVCLNYGQAEAPRQILDRSILLDGDIGQILKELKG